MSSDVAALHRLIESAYRGDSAKAGWTHEADLLGGQRTDEAELLDILADAGLSLADTVATEVEIGRAFVDDSQSARRGEDSLWRGDFMLGHQREEALALIAEWTAKG